NGDFFALLDPIEQLAESVLGLEGANFPHGCLIYKLVYGLAYKGQASLARTKLSRRTVDTIAN
ncbi:MAG TPA: hypothetical protein VN702_01280, partial [Acetobacteraceae bacterium]|nr:hypothetical protein [Acetobacteraceae bacterium]